MKFEFSDKQRQYIINAVDSFVRQTGLVNAEDGLAIVRVMQVPATEPKTPTNGNGNGD